MISFKSQKTKFKILKSTDQDFVLKDGIFMASRAGLEIDTMCPNTYRNVIMECINNGWLKPVATVYDHELTYQRLIS